MTEKSCSLMLVQFSLCKKLKLQYGYSFICIKITIMIIASAESDHHLRWYMYLLFSACLMPQVLLEWLLNAHHYFISVLPMNQSYFCTHFIKILKDKSNVTTDQRSWKSNISRNNVTIPLSNLWYELLLHPTEAISLVPQLPEEKWIAWSIVGKVPLCWASFLRDFYTEHTFSHISHRFITQHWRSTRMLSFTLPMS